MATSTKRISATYGEYAEIYIDEATNTRTGGTFIYSTNSQYMFISPYDTTHGAEEISQFHDATGFLEFDTTGLAGFVTGLTLTLNFQAIPATLTMAIDKYDWGTLDRYDIIMHGEGTPAGAVTYGLTAGQYGVEKTITLPPSWITGDTLRLRVSTPNAPALNPATAIYLKAYSYSLGPYLTVTVEGSKLYTKVSGIQTGAKGLQVKNGGSWAGTAKIRVSGSWYDLAKEFFFFTWATGDYNGYFWKGDFVTGKLWNKQANVSYTNPVYNVIQNHIGEIGGFQTYGSSWYYFMKLNPDGVLQWSYNMGKSGACSCCNEDGYWYVGNYRNQIFRFASAGGAEWATYVGDSAYAMQDIACGGLNTPEYISTVINSSNSVRQIDNYGNSTVTNYNVTAAPNRICLNKGRDRLYTLEGYSLAGRKIKKFTTPSLNLVAGWEIALTSDSPDMAIDGNENIYVCTGNNLRKYDINGVQQWEVSNATINCEKVAVSPKGYIIVQGNLKAGGQVHGVALYDFAGNHKQTLSTGFAVNGFSSISTEAMFTGGCPSSW